MIRWATTISKVFAGKKSVSNFIDNEEDKNTAEKLARNAYFLLFVMLTAIIIRLPFAIMGLIFVIVGSVILWFDTALNWIIGTFLGMDKLAEYCKQKVKIDQKIFSDLKKKYGVPE